MNVSCNVIKDLIPLYVEDMVSDESANLIEQHLKHCEECQNFLDELKQTDNVPSDKNPMPLWKMKSALRRKKLVTILFTFIFTLLLSSVFFAFLNTPNYLPYSEDIASVNELEDGSVVVEFSEEVSGYEVISSPSEVHDGYIYDITAWNTTWNEQIRPNNVGTIMLNPNGETVSSVYYYQTDGTINRHLFGNNEYENGGAMILPRLYLNYYLTAALVLAILLIGAMWVFRRNKKRMYSISVVLLIPISYIVSHFVIKGFDFDSYHATRDFISILLTAILLFSVMLLGLKLFTLRKERKVIEQFK